MPDAVEPLFLLLAGVVAGVIGTSGGITSLVAYPALLAVGIPPLAANVTNAVSLLGSGFGSAVRSGPELAGHGSTIRAWMPLTMLLSLSGAVLLILTPSRAFDRIVPFLLATGAITLLLQPLIARSQARRGAGTNRAAVVLAGAGTAVYNGYFGAGAGILMIAVLLLGTEPVLPRANALKNVILLAADVLPAILFAFTGGVVWAAVWPLGIGALLGGLIGPSVARRVPADALRILIASSGLALAAWLLFR
ncbi:MAG TPA: sulfite exporter TauE/SafE family protein [Amnibacterium sp.]|uniref:sulfite exporter TauE/SafE family protein n=1 Tax=Amnibacterium sp. TaxID=1872496 RepID=UPI002F95AEBC